MGSYHPSARAAPWRRWSEDSHVATPRFRVVRLFLDTVAAQDHRLALAATRSTQPLAQTGNRRWGADLDDALDRTDIDAKLESRRADRRSWSIRLLERFFGIFANFFGEIAVMRPELVRESHLFAGVTEGISVVFDLTAGFGNTRLLVPRSTLNRSLAMEDLAISAEVLPGAAVD